MYAKDFSFSSPPFPSASLSSTLPPSLAFIAVKDDPETMNEPRVSRPATYTAVIKHLSLG